LEKKRYANCSYPFAANILGSTPCFLWPLVKIFHFKAVLFYFNCALLFVALIFDFKKEDLNKPSFLKELVFVCAAFIFSKEKIQRARDKGY